MRDLLHPCVSCHEHIRVTETACPFCNAIVPSDFAERARARAPSSATRPLSRAAILFVGATAASACAGEEAPTPAYGPATVDSGTGDSASDAAVDSGGIDGAVVLYGPAMVDSGVDGAPDGSGPVDSGGG